MWEYLEIYISLPPLSVSPSPHAIYDFPVRVNSCCWDWKRPTFSRLLFSLHLFVAFLFPLFFVVFSFGFLSFFFFIDVEGTNIQV